MLRGLAQLLHFARREVAPLADGEALQLERSKRCATQLLHGHAKLKHERTNLQIAMFRKFKMHHSALAIAIDQHQRTARRQLLATTRRKNLALEFLDSRFIKISIKRDVVTLRNFVARMRESIGELAIVGENEQARGIEIQSTDAIQARLLRMIDKINRARTTFGIAVGAHRATRLEEHHIEVLLGAFERLSIDKNRVALSINPRGQHVNDVSIHRDCAAENELFALASRRYTCFGEDLL